MKRNFSTVKTLPLLLTLSSVAFLNINCGKKGPLTLEPERLPQAVTGFKTIQVGKNLKLEWTFPTKLSDQESEFDINQVERLYVYYSDKKIEPGKFKRKALLYKKYKRDDFELENDRYSVQIPFSLKNLDDGTHFLAVMYYYGKKKSPLSKIDSIKTINPVRPISDLKITKEKKVFKLNWSKPSLNLSDKNIKNIAGYQVYRKTSQPGTEPVRDNYTRINSNTLLVEYYEDTDTGTDGTYSYYVTTVSSDVIESGPSNHVSSDMEDTYPPDPPANLAIFKAGDHLYLTWERVKDRDLSHYILYRRKTLKKDDDEALFRPIAEKITDTYFKDTGVEKGYWYHYYLTAVDEKGNESSRSIIGKEQF